MTIVRRLQRGRDAAGRRPPRPGRVVSLHPASARRRWRSPSSPSASCGRRSTSCATPTPTDSLVVGVAIVVGVGGVFFLYWAMNRVVDLLPERYREGVRPYVFVGPALVILGVFLVYPVINTILISLKDAQGESFVGLDNFKFVFTDESMLRAIRNTLGWIAGRAGGRREHRARVRHAGRSPPARRGRRQVADLPADGDLVRRRRDHLAADLRLPPGGVRLQHRPR